ncbi:MAG TPA: ATP-binding protein, partial [Myxococcaceae bacterium]|nr:ATP-binding protein [Myxococcaceae bacterium]
GRALVFELANAAYFQLVGHRDILGKPLREALPEVEGQGYFELLDSVLTSGEPFIGRGMKVALQREPGAALSEAFIDLNYQPIFGEDGKVEGILVQGQDVTEVRQQEAKRREAEARYRTLFESIDDGFCLIQLLFDDAGLPVDYRFLEANGAFERQSGLIDAVGRTARTLVPDLDPSWFRLYGDVALTGKTIHFENYAAAMGRWFDVYASRVGDPTQRQVALVFKDVTDRKAAEEAVRRSEEVERERLRSLLSRAPVAMSVMSGPDLVFELANNHYARMVGRSADALLGLPFRAAFPELPPDAHVFAVMEGVYASGKAFSAEEYRVPLDRRGDGTREDAYFQFVSEPMHDDAGRVSSILSVAVDVTPQVEARRRLEALAQERERLLTREKEARAEAEEANRLKDEFLATMSHELRTPLTAILGWIQVLRTRTLPAGKQERALETVERNARAQKQLIEDLLDVSRILSGKLGLEIGPVRVSEVVDEALESVRPAAEAKGIRLQAALDSTGTVMGDPRRVQQIVWNLLSNAVKFTPKGGRVQVLVERGESSVELTVADTGQGIDPTFLPHVFERFRQQEGGTTRGAGGLGLGLAIVRHLVELHGGTVAVQSEGKGQGSTFTVRLPVSVALRRDVEVPLALRESARMGAFECPPQLDGVHVLVVDDEEDARELVRTLLEGCRARVTTAASAQEGLTLLHSERPDLLVSDVGMPGEDGYAFIGQVRALGSKQGGETPAVALTAYARAEDRTRVLLAGFSTHVPKPVEPLELLAVLASLVGRTGAAKS